MASEPPSHKVVMLGDSGVGKTSIVLRLCEKVFRETTAPTVGSGYAKKEFQTKNGTVILHIWDTAGEERYRSFTSLYSQNASLAFVVYDITDRKSFESVEDWVRIFRDHVGNDAPFVLLGNKVDNPDKREVTFNEAYELANRLNATNQEVSAKTGENVDNAFMQAVEIVATVDAPALVSPKENTETPGKNKCC